MIKFRQLFEDYVRGFDKDTYPNFTADLFIIPMRLEWAMNRDVSVVMSLLLFAIFWLGIENYVEIIQSFVEILRRRRL